MGWTPHELLAEVSARLGDIRLIIDQSQIGLFEQNRAYRESRKLLFPWLIQLEEFEYGDLSGPNSVITNAVRALVSMEESGFEADVTKIARVACDSYQKHSDRKESEDCATTILQAESYINSGGWQSLRMLDRIASAAVEQNL